MARKRPVFLAEMFFGAAAKIRAYCLAIWGSNPIEQKKEEALTTSSFRVPYGIRTHDIQNHNLTL